MSRVIVGFCGYAGSGKDTAGLAVAAALGGASFVNFADPLKTVCATALGLSWEEMNDPALKSEPLKRWPGGTPRHHMQHIGTEMFRAQYPGVWVEAWKRAVGQHGNVICTDVRFPDEAAALKEMGGVLVRVRRPGDNFDGHKSEQPDLLVHQHCLFNEHSISVLQHNALAWLIERENVAEVLAANKGVIVGERVVHDDGDQGVVLEILRLQGVLCARVQFYGIETPLDYPVSQLRRV